MTTLMLRLSVVIFTAVLITPIAWAQAGVAENFVAEDQAFHAGWNAAMRSPHSPLKPSERAHFRGIPWFSIQASYRVTARFAKSPSAETFMIPTSSGSRDVYVKSGVLTFTLDHHLCRLAAYRSAAPGQSDDLLFVPFTDKTSGTQSYGGGRYLDIPLPRSDRVTLDFNRAYNPYCAYTEGYSCPIPPAENRLPVAVLAGAKAYRH